MDTTHATADTDPARELRARRREAGLTTRGLARLLGTTHATISRYESGKRGISKPMAMLMRMVLAREARKRARVATLERGGDRGNQYTGGKVSRDTLPDAKSIAGAARMTGAKPKSIKRRRPRPRTTYTPPPADFAIDFAAPTTRSRHRAVRGGRRSREAASTNTTPITTDPGGKPWQT